MYMCVYVCVYISLIYIVIYIHTHTYIYKKVGRDKEKGNQGKREDKNGEKIWILTLYISIGSHVGHKLDEYN